ncbi:HdeA/HdeB family chaperone [Paraburkholderia hospita]|uniref:HdeA/HdeB family chaperone n=1 Tax=Paraburkholderia hospita TaxID=169430 RepID=UPI000B3443A2|nr:HdeA/HdeB family chaperone [Paraburkholderia hospita]OUL79521.1 hypothetical protein CA601_34675 [Paraburkholderia hospita]
MKILTLIIASGLCISQLAFSQTALTVHPSKLKCEDFLSLADQDKPALLYWVAGTGKRTIRANDELVVDAAAPVALIVAECRKAPNASFIDEVKRLSKSGEFSIVK